MKKLRASMVNFTSMKKIAKVILPLYLSQVFINISIFKFTFHIEYIFTIYLIVTNKI